MTDKEKYDIIEKEINEMYKKQFEEERKQKFKSEIEAIEFSHKFHEKIVAHIKKRKKELGLYTKQ